MSTTVEPEVTERPQPVLTPKLDPRFALSAGHVLVVLVLGMLFLLFNYFPLRGSDLWLHVLYGQWILEHGQLPAYDPFMPLAEGMRVIDSAWLSQIIFAAVAELGHEWLSHLFALTMFAAYVILMRTFYLQTGGRLLVSLLGVILVVIVGWSRITTIRPENFGWLLFSILLLLLVDQQCHREKEGRGFGLRLWLGVPVIMALWANLHGSFMCGLALLGCFALGQLIDVARSRRSLKAALASGSVWRWIALAEFGLLATLLNPYGIELLVNSFTFASNPNLSSVLEWQSLVFKAVGGREFMLSLVLLVVLLRYSRRPIPATHVLLVVVFGGAAVLSIRMMSWYAAVFALMATPHIAELLPRRRKAAAQEPSQADDADTPLAAEVVATNGDGGDSSETAAPLPTHGRTPPAQDPQQQDEDAAQPQPITLPPGRSFAYTLVCCLLVWIVLMLSPLAFSIMGNPIRKPRQLHERHTSLALTEYLRHDPKQKSDTPGPAAAGRTYAFDVENLVFAPQHWGDWIVLDGPHDKNGNPLVKPFATSNIHVIPHRVWQDYLIILQGRAGWERTLDRYKVRTLIIDKERQPLLSRYARRSDYWRKQAETEEFMVFVRIPYHQPAR